MDISTALKEKLMTAEVKGSQWLADGNAASERGDSDRAQRCYDKAQFWLDRANTLRDRLYEAK